MAKDKKSFLMYADQIDLFMVLDVKQRGILITQILAYVNDMDPPDPSDPLVLGVWLPLRLQLKRDLTKWEGIKKSRSKAGKASAEARKIRRNQQVSTNSTSVESVQQNQQNQQVSTNSTVNVNVNDNVNVTDILLEKESKDSSDKSELTGNSSSPAQEPPKKKPKAKKVDYSKKWPETVEKLYSEVLPFFAENLRPKKDSVIFLWKDTIDKLMRIDGHPPEVVYEIVKMAREDGFIAKNFQSIAKLRDSKNGVMYIDQYADRFKSRHDRSVEATRQEWENDFPDLNIV